MFVDRFIDIVNHESLNNVKYEVSYHKKTLDVYSLS